MFRPRPNHPYARAPRLPEQPLVLFEELLPGAGPLEVEIGPGRGGFLFERATARPDVRMLGLEIRLKWATLVDERLRAAGFGGRVRALNADAKEALAKLGPDACVDVFYLHFPDPWWKARHSKRLVMGDVLLDSVARLLRDGGELFVQTDVEDRFELYRAQIDGHPSFEPFGDEPGSAVLALNPYQAMSPREHHAVRDGLPIHRLRYRRKSRAT